MLQPLVEGLPSALTGRILVRWRIEDLLAGASDLESFNIASAFGWQFFIRLNFHGKVFEFPEQGILVGSANATGAGFGITAEPNVEACTLVQDTSANRAVTDSFFVGATLVTPELFIQLQSALDDVRSAPTPSADWPADILSRLASREAPKFLLVSSCFLSSPSAALNPTGPLSSDASSDLALLGLRPTEISDATLRTRALQRTAVFLWLLKLLKQSGSECFFGTAAAALHSSLADDPVPQRREVKVLLQNLVEWIAACPGCGVEVDRPNYSQRLRLSEA